MFIIKLTDQLICSQTINNATKNKCTPNADYKVVILEDNINDGWITQKRQFNAETKDEIGIMILTVTTCKRGILCVHLARVDKCTNIQNIPFKRCIARPDDVLTGR